MSTTGTETKTYTVADIRKVVENFAADFSMMAQATGLRTRENVAGVVSDLRVFAETGYLVKVTLVLRDKSGVELRGAVYEVASSALGWTSERWPRTPHGSLHVRATLSGAWWQLTDAQRTTFIANHSLNGSWPVADDEITFAGLTASAGQKYASNGYGWDRTNWS